MDIAKLQKKLLSVARADVPSDRVPFTFEKRVMAHLRQERAMAWGAEWSALLWRAVVACVCVAILAGAWVALRPSASAGASLDFSDQLESAVLVAADLDTSSTDSAW